MEDFQLGIIGNWRGRFALMSDEAFYDEEAGWGWQIYKEDLTDLQLEAALAAVKARMKLPIAAIRDAYYETAKKWKEAVRPERLKLAETQCLAEILEVIKYTQKVSGIIRMQAPERREIGERRISKMFNQYNKRHYKRRTDKTASWVRYLFVINKGAENEFTIGKGSDNTLKGINRAREEYRAQTRDYAPVHISEYVYEQLFIHSIESKERHLKVVD